MMFSIRIVNGLYALGTIPPYLMWGHTHSKILILKWSLVGLDMCITLGSMNLRFVSPFLGGRNVCLQL